MKKIRTALIRRPHIFNRQHISREDLLNGGNR